MKALYKCDYCTKIGTEEELVKHEENCSFNVKNKTCDTCKNAHITQDHSKHYCKLTRSQEELEHMTDFDFSAMFFGSESTKDDYCINCENWVEGKPSKVTKVIGL